MSPELFNQNWLVGEYLKHGSIGQVYDDYSKKNSGRSIPVAHASFHRALDSFDIEKGNPGPKTKLVDAILFFEEMVLTRMPLERLYIRMPARFRERIHTATLHRIHNSILKKIARRHATAIIATPIYDPFSILVGQETSADLRYGKHKNDTTIPMCYTQGKSVERDLLKVFQSEMFAQKATDGNLGFQSDTVQEILSNGVNKVMTLNIVDVAVDVYFVTLPSQLSEQTGFSSYKLKDHHFADISQLGQHMRQGIPEIISGYSEFLKVQPEEVPQIYSDLNLAVESLQKGSPI